MKIYVDDTLELWDELPRGAEWDEDDNKIIIDNTKIDEDEQLEGDERTMKIMNKIANSIDPDIMMGAT